MLLVMNFVFFMVMVRLYWVMSWQLVVVAIFWMWVMIGCGRSGMLFIMWLYWLKRVSIFGSFFSVLIFFRLCLV